ncbi:MFS transporter [Subtercola sp. YIM 133946]|uniref:MFS transporter n=1 Tax=Subtercola sp. YIM 133946 TaxID=3118909 RepID=UPI002F929761
MKALTDQRAWTLRLTVLAATAAVAVSTIYLPQSMLTNMATSLGVTPAVAGIAATTVQVGYAIGIFLLVPLSDRIQPRRQITVQLVLLAVAMLATAALPEIVGVGLGFFVVGLVANIAQLTIPAANKLAPEGRSGATTTALVGALLVGIFGGRVLASVLVEALGWRLVVVVFAALVLATVPLFRRALRVDVRLDSIGTSYGALLAGTLALVRSSPTVLPLSAINFFAFATLNSLWTVMVLHLTGPEFGWSVAGAGLFGLVGLAAGVVTPLGGRLIDRFGALPVAGVSLAVLLVATATVIVDSGSIVVFAVSMFFITWANQSAQSANQNRVLRTNAEASAQANTVFMVAVFLGGSLGAFLGVITFDAGGMPAVAVQAVVLVLLAIVCWAAAVRSARRAGTRLRST